MRIETQCRVEASVDGCWEVLGRRFGEIGQWASAIVESRMDGLPATGAVRVCTLKGFGGLGAMQIHEELIEFDSQRMRLAYRVSSGMPTFVRSAINRWTVEDAGSGHSVITSRADITVAWYMLPAMPLLRLRMARDVRALFDELKFRIERSVCGGSHLLRSYGPNRLSVE